jgi:8-oxo-dGTP diphosphatase
MIQVGVGAIVVRNLRGFVELLLVQRKNDPGCGSWAVPGGRMKFGESLQQCAEREVKEETGLVVDAEERGCYAFDIVVPEKNLQFVVVDVKATLRGGFSQECVAGDDAADVCFADKYLFGKLNVNSETRRLVSFLRLFD